ncbi:MAG: peptidyl-tRNA hydrolase Pth2 [Candidatus Bathyarchaeia archaeon]
MARGFKQAIVVRRDLRMGKGKLAAQVAHAAVAAAEEAREKFPSWWGEWMREGQKKVVLRVEGEEELLGIYEESRRRGLPAALVRDMGLTQLPPGTATCAGIGPAPEPDLDALVGRLKLL